MDFCRIRGWSSGQTNTTFCSFFLLSSRLSHSKTNGNSPPPTKHTNSGKTNTTFINLNVGLLPYLNNYDISFKVSKSNKLRHSAPSFPPFPPILELRHSNPEPSFFSFRQNSKTEIFLQFYILRWSNSSSVAYTYTLFLHSGSVIVETARLEFGLS